MGDETKKDYNNNFGKNGAEFSKSDFEETILNLNDPRLYINRELSWLKLHERILEESRDPNHPLLERVKFLAICGGNLDEFFMVRVSALDKQVMNGSFKLSPDGMTPHEQLVAIRREVLSILRLHEDVWNRELLQELAEEGIRIMRVVDLNESQQIAVRKYFELQIFPALTPLALDSANHFPFISNLSLNLAVILRDKKKHEWLAKVKVPTNIFPRLQQLQLEEYEEDVDRRVADHGITLLFLEDIIASNLDQLFPGIDIVSAYPFRITRDAEVEISLDQTSDLLNVIEESIKTRRSGKCVRLEVDKSMPESLREVFMKNMGLTPDAVYAFDGPLGFIDFWQLLKIDRPDLKDKTFLPFMPTKLRQGRDYFKAISKRDYVLYHPYDNFNVLINLLKQAAVDPGVLAIKITLYRIDKKSPIVDALRQASRHRKNVTALVELKAKFDEKNNINWAKRLEHAGVHVAYGFPDLKVHAKLCLIVRKEGDKIIRYSHLSSGNYNSVTSRIYGDIGYLTANQEIGTEVNNLFNYLTGYSQKDDYSCLLVAPKTLKKEIISRINREIERHQKDGNGYIAIKVNNLDDKDIIKTLYLASQAGVRVDLNIRALCCLRPGIKGVSDNIREISIIGRFLEHSRIYYFRNGGEEEVLLGSSDLMPRNLEKRIEVLFPVPDPRLRRLIIDKMLNVHLNDTVKARELMPDGSWKRVKPIEGKEPINSQQWLIDHKGEWHSNR
ncbi:MAG: polyphosphate kinase 1 [Candidatus Bathyarchaeia archaeon]|jgi:polyphosphate kinase